MFQCDLKTTSFLLVLCGFGFLCNVVSKVGAVEYYTEKPDWLETCEINKPEFTKCSTRSIQKFMDHLTNGGLPEVTAKFGPLDPLKLDQVIFKEDNNQAVTITANLTDLIAKGLSKIVVKESKVSKKDYHWETKIFMPSLSLDGQYKMSGKILLIPLNGAGKIRIDIENLDILLHTRTHLYEKGGFTFYNVTKLRIDLKVGRVKSNLEHIFKGASEEVERSTNEFFNENWKEFFEALRPLLTKTIEDILINILSAAFNLIPANFFVGDIPTSTELYAKKS